MDLQTIGDSIFTLTLDTSNKKLEIANKEKELRECKLYKEIEELKSQDREINNEIIKRKKNIKEGMEKLGLKSMEFEHQKVTLKKSPGSIKVLNEGDIPRTYRKEKITETLDKKKLKDGITAGDVVPGATIEYTYSLLMTAK